MRTVLHELELVAVSTRLPADGETARIALGAYGPRGRGDHLDLPAFATDPRQAPGIPTHLRKRIDRFSAVAYLAVAEALATLTAEQRPAADRIGLFLANTRAGWSYGEPELGLLVHSGAESMHAYQATAWFPAAAQGEITIELDLRGCAKTTSGSESGFGEALWLARDALERGAIDLAVVGAAESLVTGFVLRDWAQQHPLPDSGPAEGAVVFALRRPSGSPAVVLGELRHRADGTGPDGIGPDGSWVPTLAAAVRLHRSVGRPATGSESVALGGGYWITVIPMKERTVNTVLSETTVTGDYAAVARHELVIPGPVADVFEMTRDVTRWSEYMPAVTAAAFRSESTDGDLVEITAEANNQKHTWQSRRTVDRAAWTIDFSRVGAVEPLLSMEGRWQFIAGEDGTRAVLTHRYATTSQDSLDFYGDATRSNATRDLEGLAEYFSTKANR
ncbi:MAG TPA: beta-ketoacyl synthase N-terminal-like domain-containing protein [Pseudonocardiaceae bacterium]